MGFFSGLSANGIVKSLARGPISGEARGGVDGISTDGRYGRVPPRTYSGEALAGAGAPAPHRNPQAEQRQFAEKIRRTGGLNGMGYIPQSADRNLLARIIYAESHEHPGDYAAIGWSTVNRVGRRPYRATLNDVLHQPGAFAIVSEGSSDGRDSDLWVESDRPDLLTGRKRELWRHAEKMATGILSGQVADPTGGATLFFASDRFDPNDIDSAPGDFPRMLQRERIRPSKFRTTARGARPQYFFLETEQARPLPSRR